MTVPMTAPAIRNRQGLPPIDPELYPFQSRYVQLTRGHMHYIDEGHGETVLLVHGTPTWSFLYRDFFKALRSSYRCIAVDHIGFGLSEKPPGFAGTPKEHSENLSEFIERLHLDSITLVVHDFGGPIGLAAGLQAPQKIRRVIAFNTWLWETRTNAAAKKVEGLLSSWFGKLLYLRFNISVNVLMKSSFHNRKLLKRRVHDHYRLPFPEYADRNVLLQLGRSLVGSSDWYADQQKKLGLLADKPWLLLWGLHDPFLTVDFLEQWKAMVPAAQIETFDCGHFVQEEMTEDSIASIHRFLVNT